MASGLLPFGVLVHFSLPSVPRISQAQPLPNWVVAAVLKASLNACTLPKSSTSFFSSAPGMPPPVADMFSQNRMWFQCWPALLNTGAIAALPLDSFTISSRDLPWSAASFSTKPFSAVT